MASEEVIHLLCSYLNNVNKRLLMPTVKCLSSMFASTEPAVVDISLKAGVLYQFTEILESNSTELINLALFGLSNIAAGTP